VDQTQADFLRQGKPERWPNGAVPELAWPTLDENSDGAALVPPVVGSGEPIRALPHIHETPPGSADLRLLAPLSGGQERAPAIRHAEASGPATARVAGSGDADVGSGKRTTNVRRARP
jgi:hypothetical protein